MRRPAPLCPRLLSSLLLLALAACGAEPPPPAPEPEVLPCEAEARPARDVGVCPPGAVPEEGLAAFRTACAQCHVNSDDWDQAHFGPATPEARERARTYLGYLRVSVSTSTKETPTSFSARQQVELNGLLDQGLAGLQE